MQNAQGSSITLINIDNSDQLFSTAFSRKRKSLARRNVLIYYTGNENPERQKIRKQGGTERVKQFQVARCLLDTAGAALQKDIHETSQD